MMVEMGELIRDEKRFGSNASFRKLIWGLGRISSAPTNLDVWDCIRLRPIVSVRPVLDLHIEITNCASSCGLHGLFGLQHGFRIAEA